MSQVAQALDFDFERQRVYLCLLARKHLDRRLWRLVDPSDVVQATLLDAQCKRDQFRGQTSEEWAAWLRRMVLNDLKDAVRKFRPIADREELHVAVELSSVWIDATLAGEQSSPSEQAQKHEELQRLAEALEKLPEAEREAVMLHHLFEWTQAEIAERLGRTRPAVAGLLCRGLKRLRELLSALE